MRDSRSDLGVAAPVRIPQLISSAKRAAMAAAALLRRACNAAARPVALPGQRACSRSFHHISVMPTETVNAWAGGPAAAAGPGARFIDCTLGGGGHSSLLLQRLPTAQLLAFDQDAEALAAARPKLLPPSAADMAAREQAVWLVHGSYTGIAAETVALGWTGNVAGILADVGVSSHQLDAGYRGFSFMHDGPLDMRFDGVAAGNSGGSAAGGKSSGSRSGSSATAADLVNHLPEPELARIIRVYGQDPGADVIARGIVEMRARARFQSTAELAAVVKTTVERAGGRVAASQKRGIHPATRTFQALRIAVNDELRAVETLLQAAPRLLAPGGRLALITFHSLEHELAAAALKRLCSRVAGAANPAPAFAALFKPKGYLLPSEAELAVNRRSRSARLWVLERLHADHAGK